MGDSKPNAYIHLFCGRTTVHAQQDPFLWWINLEQVRMYQDDPPQHIRSP